MDKRDILHEHKLKECGSVCIDIGQSSFQNKEYWQGLKCHFIMIKQLIQEDIKVININLPNNRTSRQMKQKTTENQINPSLYSKIFTDLKK